MVPLRGVHVRQATPPLPDNSVVTDLDFDAFDALTFDCYGTLIDWEAGITVGLRRILDRHAVDATDDQLLEAFAAAESRLEARPYLPYRTILAAAARAVGQGLGIEVDDDEASEFGGSVGDKRLGFHTVWIDRRHDRPGSGATLPAVVQPDATYPSMAAFAEAAARG